MANAARMTKAERRKTQLDEIKAYATDNGIDLDVSNMESMKNALIEILVDLDLEPELDEKNRSIKCRNVDTNGYRVGKNKIWLHIKTMRSEMLRLVRLKASGGPRLIGDLSNIQIAICARKILCNALGEEWPRRIQDEIKEKYEKGYGFGKSYVKLDDKVGFKIVQEQILVEAQLGKSYYRNGNLVMPGVELPQSTLVSLVGRNANEIIEGQPYGNAFDGVPISSAECPDKTTIISLDEERELVSGEKK